MRLFQDQGDTICCAGCHNVVASVDQICRVLGRPPRKTYVNPHGLLCPVLTLTGGLGLKQAEFSSTEKTWFEGYAWRPVSCAACELFLGWRFEAVAPQARPRTFYGLLEERLVSRPGGPDEGV